MGILDLIFKKKKKQTKTKEKEEFEPKQAVLTKHNQENNIGGRGTIEEMSMQIPTLYSPTVEHPLLTIQDRISKLEEIYKSLNDRIILIDGKMATKNDISDLKAIMQEDLIREEDILAGIDNLSNKLDSLRKVRAELIRQVDASQDELTRKQELLKSVNQKIELIECDEKIINSLREGDASTIELAEKLGLTRQYIWGRLKELEAGGYVKSAKSGRKTKYHLIKDR